MCGRTAPHTVCPGHAARLTGSTPSFQTLQVPQHKLSATAAATQVQSPQERQDRKTLGSSCQEPPV